MSINAHFTFNYSQPAEYRFSHDSVFLAREIFERERARINPGLRILDLCAGCGIVGLDFLFHTRVECGVTEIECDFVEIQDVYRPHFEENVRRFAPSAHRLNFLHVNYAHFSHDKKYDLILSNPPYFLPGAGKLSPSQFKNRCRFFMDAEFKDLFHMIDQSLGFGGVAYLLSRQPLEKVRTFTADPTRIVQVGEIRGTRLLKINGTIDLSARPEAGVAAARAADPPSTAI